MRAPETTSGLYIVLETGEGAGERLAAALATAPIAAVLLRSQAGPLPANATLRALIEAAQSRGCAALIADDAGLARALRADGVHLNWTSDIAGRYAEARDVLGTRYIVGADAGRSRHDAMMLGEAGADYVGFEIDAGQPDDPDGLDMIRWWAEIFEVPCVALGIATEAQVLAAAGTGADFFALHLRNGLAAGEAAALIRSAAAALAAPRGSG